MADNPKHEEVAFILKVGGYIIGILLGLAAKLAIVNKEKPLTIKDFVYHSSIAFASAWLVWAILSYYGHIDIAAIVSVVVGRYGDIILIAAYNKTLEFFKEIKPRTRL